MEDSVLILGMEGRGVNDRWDGSCGELGLGLGNFMCGLWDV